MRNSWLALLLAFISLTGCRSKVAFDFSESIVAIERKLGESITVIQPDIIRYIQEGNMDSLVVAGGDMEKKVERSIEEVKALKTPDIKEAESFKATSIRYFTHIKNIYGSYRTYAEQTDESLREAERERMIRLEEDMDGLVKEMQEAQQKFAKANGFRVESSK